MKRLLLTLAVSAAGLACAAMAKYDALWALESAAGQMAEKINASPRVTGSVKNIAFAKLRISDGVEAFDNISSEAKTFESALMSVPGKLNFVVHTGNESDWKLIDEIFDQKKGFDDWARDAGPQLKKLKLCDAIAFADVIYFHEEDDVATVKIDAHVVKVDTAEELFSEIIEGSYSDGGPDNEQVSIPWRETLKACAGDAVAKLSPRLDGYGILLVPIVGKTGKSLKQVFFNELMAANSQGRFHVYDLPNGNAADQRFARFFAERLVKQGGGLGVSDVAKRSAHQFATARGLTGKLVVMVAKISAMDESPKGELTRNGVPVDFVGGAVSDAAAARKRYELIADFKFLDINGNFEVIDSVEGRGVYEPPKTIKDKLEDSLAELGFGITVGGIVTLAVGVLALLVILGLIAKICKSLSRPR